MGYRFVKLVRTSSVSKRICEYVTLVRTSVHKANTRPSIG